MQLSPPPVTSSLLGSNILLSTLFSNTLSLCSSLNVTDQFSHQYKISYNYSFVYFNLCVFRWQMGRQNIMNCMVVNIP
jgi:hypothetical protein